jgi:thermitase
MTFPTSACLARLGILFTSLAALTFVPLRASAQADAPVVPGELLVGMRSGSGRASTLSTLSRTIGQAAAGPAALGAYRFRLRPGLSMQAAIAQLRQNPDVLYVEPNYIRHAYATPNDTYYASAQYAPAKIQADLAWDNWQPQAQVIVAIIDTGIDSVHPDLTNVIARDGAGAVIGYNAITNTANAADDQGHGTHCAGIAAAQINNGQGVAGLAGWNPNVPGSNQYIKLMPVKVLNSAGSGSDADVAEGITWAADRGAKVISLSLGGPGFSNTLNNAVQYAWGKGAVVVAAAGNESTSTPSYPAAYNNVVSVAATDSTDTLASYSNFGPWVKVAAPGTQIASTYPGGRYVYMSGTSMATPYVAGEVAAIRAQNPGLAAEQVNSAVLSNVDPYNPYVGRTIASGAGRINVYRALQAAGVGTPPAPANAALVSVSVNPASVTGGTSATGTVTLSAAAPAGGAVVTLASSNTAAAQVPASATVPSGLTSATFTVSTQPVAANAAVVLSASYGDATKTTSLTVNTPVPASVAFNPASVTGGAASTGTVTLTGPAPAGGTVVTLTSSSTAAATVPPSVTVGAGATSASFSAATQAVAGNTNVTVSAACNGGSRSGTLTVKTPVPSSLTLSPATVRGGNSSTGTVTLSGLAPAGGAVVTLATGNSSLAKVPASVTVPAGSNRATFTITTVKVTRTYYVSLSASRAGVVRYATLTVTR